MKIKTADLKGAALDWAVAKCEGIDVVILTPDEQIARWFEHVEPAELEKKRADFNTYIARTLKPELCVVCDDGYKRAPIHTEARMLFNEGPPKFRFSTSWAQGGPIIEREFINVGTQRNEPGFRPHPDRMWHAQMGTRVYVGYGPTPLVAAMRCFVASKLGDEVCIPDELANA